MHYRHAARSRRSTRRPSDYRGDPVSRHEAFQNDPAETSRRVYSFGRSHRNGRQRDGIDIGRRQRQRRSSGIFRHVSTAPHRPARPDRDHSGEVRRPADDQPPVTAARRHAVLQYSRPASSIGEAVAKRSSKCRARRCKLPGVDHDQLLRHRQRSSRMPRRVRSPLIHRGRSSTIYIVLGVLYESFIHPITILSGLPSAGLGALMALWQCSASTSRSSPSSAFSC